MAQIYKIYINEVILILTESLPPKIEDYQELKVSDFDFFSFYKRISNHQSPKTFLLLTKKFKSVFKEIKRAMILIKAAGGIVSNEANKYLFIFRNGKWDLPKGKIEKGENSRVAAVREVQEECGIRIDSCRDKVCNTYHIYEINGAMVIKKTAWYWMRAIKQKKLIPQLEEGITDARWLSTGDLMLVRQNTYPLIRDLINVLK
jgi:hypothetical protein